MRIQRPSPNPGPCPRPQLSHDFVAMFSSAVQQVQNEQVQEALDQSFRDRLSQWIESGPLTYQTSIFSAFDINPYVGLESRLQDIEVQSRMKGPLEDGCIEEFHAELDSLTHLFQSPNQDHNAGR